MPFKKYAKLDQWGVEATPQVLESDNMTIKSQEENKNETNKVSYAQNWPAYNEAQTQEKILFLELLHDLTSQIPRQNQRRRGRPTIDIGDMIFCCCLKIYLDFSSRRTESDVKMAYNLGYIDHTPHFNTILNYLNKPELSMHLTRLIHLSALPLKDFEKNFAVDATGFSTSMFGRWLDLRYMKNEIVSKRKWVKCHIMSGTQTNVITHVEITDFKTNDSVMFPSLIDNTANFFDMERVVGDKGYSSRRNLQITVKHGAIPYIPFKKNTSWKQRGAPIWKIMYRYFVYNREEFMQYYHKRSNVESTFSMMKRKFGDHLRTKNDVAMANEILCKSLVHNICVLIQEMFALGVKIDFQQEAPSIFCAEPRIG